MSHNKHIKAFAAPDAIIVGKKSLIGLSHEELTTEMVSFGLPKFRAKQLWQWIYNKGVTDFSEMTNISKKLQPELDAAYIIPRLKIKEKQISKDGTRKWLLTTPDNQDIETVYIPDKKRGTLCVSSQVGCTLACKFCHTGTMNLVRNLNAAEIIGQIMLAKDELDDWPSTKEGREVTNIVMMGMGEPLYNYDNVAPAILTMLDTDGLGYSRRKITLSTSGLVPNITRAGEELGVALAISLHAPNDKIRSSIMGINNKYPLADLMEACRNYKGLKNSRRITWEYVMLKGVNDSDAEAYELIELLRGIPSKVNLIPFNPWPDCGYECSSNNRIHAFGRILDAAGIPSPIRKTRGEDIFAACGQLKSESQRISRHEKRKIAEKEAKNAAT